MPVENAIGSDQSAHEEDCTQEWGYGEQSRSGVEEWQDLWLGFSQVQLSHSLLRLDMAAGSFEQQSLNDGRVLVPDCQVEGGVAIVVGVVEGRFRLGEQVLDDGQVAVVARPVQGSASPFVGAVHTDLAPQVDD